MERSSSGGGRFGSGGCAALLGQRSHHGSHALHRRLQQAGDLAEQDFLARHGRQRLDAIGVQGLAGIGAGLDDQLVVALGKVGDDFGRGDSVFGKAVDQRTDDGTLGDLERRAGDGAACPEKTGSCAIETAKLRRIT